MLIKIGIIALAVLGLVFVILPFFDVAFFDFQCQETCNSCSAKTVFSSSSEDINCATTTVEAMCNMNCQSRNKRCSFDDDIKNECLSCIDKCRALEATPAENTACVNNCYNLTSA